MSDTYRRHRAIKQAIIQFYQSRPTGHREKHFTTLAALLCGLVGGRHAHLPTIADHAPSPNTRMQLDRLWRAARCEFPRCRVRASAAADAQAVAPYPTNPKFTSAVRS